MSGPELDIANVTLPGGFGACHLCPGLKPRLAGSSSRDAAPSARPRARGARVASQSAPAGGAANRPRSLAGDPASPRVAVHLLLTRFWRRSVRGRGRRARGGRQRGRCEGQELRARARAAAQRPQEPHHRSGALPLGTPPLHAPRAAPHARCARAPERMQLPAPACCVALPCASPRAPLRAAARPTLAAALAQRATAAAPRPTPPAPWRLRSHVVARGADRSRLGAAQGIDPTVDYKKVLKAFKKEFCCNGTVVEDPEQARTRRPPRGRRAAAAPRRVAVPPHAAGADSPVPAYATRGM